MSDSHDRDAVSKPQDWPLRPWLLSIVLTLAGLLVYLFSQDGEHVPWRMAITAFCVFAPLAFALTLERDDLRPTAIFAGIVGLVMAGIAWRATAAPRQWPTTRVVCGLAASAFCAICIR